MRLMFVVALVAALFVLHVAKAEPSPRAGTVTISVEEYEKLKKATEADESRQWWNMTFEQILEREKGDEEDAWELYEFWVLRTIYLTGSVNGSSTGKAIEALQVLNEISDEPITLVLSSPGGAVFDGLNLYNAMVSSPAPIHTVCDGIAASMAAVIVVAGDHRIARDACVFMLHEVAMGAPGGQTTDHIKWSDTIISFENVLLKILSKNSGLSVADVRKIGEFETFWSADEALALGFVDEVVSSKRTLAAGSRAIPKDLLPKARIARQIAERMSD